MHPAELKGTYYAKLTYIVLNNTKRQHCFSEWTRQSLGIEGI